MTCKISLNRSIRESLKHHLASIFIVCILFFIQIITFFLRIQNHANTEWDPIAAVYLYDEIVEMTLPSFSYAIPIIIVAVILAFDFFRYLHSKRQVDFYESLPMRRKDGFIVRSISSFIIFLVPYTVNILVEMLLLVTYDYTQVMFFTNLLWNFLCMILIFIATWLTASFAMIVTGHPVVGLFGFAAISAYAPLILRYIYPSYAMQYFKTYVTDGSSLDVLYYFSPISIAVKFFDDSYLDWTADSHLEEFAAVVVFILLAGIITCFLFQKRPSEAAGRAIAFEKSCSFIRTAFVIPLTLYIGLYLVQFTTTSSKGWMIFGFVFGTIILHGLFETIFQFDIKAAWAQKKQMLFSFLVSFGIALIFWNDVFGYDDYIPKYDEIDTIFLETYDYYDTNTTKDGIHGEYLKDTYLLAERLIEQDLEYSDTVGEITMKYKLKDGKEKMRRYCIDYDVNRELFDKIYATKEFKDDLNPIYSKEWNDVTHIKWNDSVSEITLYMSTEEMENLFETYMIEYTPFTFTQAQHAVPIGEFVVCSNNLEMGEYQYSCYVYSEFAQTISLIEKFMNEDPKLNGYGSIKESPIYKYNITMLELYLDDRTATVTTQTEINNIREHIVFADYFYKMSGDYVDYSRFYEGIITFATPDGLRYISIIMQRDVADQLIETTNS